VVQRVVQPGLELEEGLCLGVDLAGAAQEEREECDQIQRETGKDLSSHGKQMVLADSLKKWITWGSCTVLNVLTDSEHLKMENKT
jgi:hypothetical protein